MTTAVIVLLVVGVLIGMLLMEWFVGRPQKRRIEDTRQRVKRAYAQTEHKGTPYIRESR